MPAALTDQRAALGHWVFKSKSSQNSTTSTSGACKGYIFGMEVTEELESWPEQDTHDRRWVSRSRSPAPRPSRFVTKLTSSTTDHIIGTYVQVSPAEAYQLCRYDWMREALTALLERLSVLQPVAAAAAAATPELAADQSGMYMMLQASSDGGAVALC